MNRPSFFIVGAPKSGTTALYEYLKEHPDIFMPEKELYFFGQDLNYMIATPSEDHYQKLFEEARSDQQCGDASVWYLRSTLAAEEIRNYASDARIIIMLRDPVEMLHALHFHQLLEGNESIENFEDALEAEEARKKGEKLPTFTASPLEALQYRELGKYCSQVRRYMETFGSERLRIIFFEEFIEAPRESYLRTLDFLGVERKEKKSFKRINPPRRFRSEALRDLFKRRPLWLTRVAKLILPVRSWRRRLLEKVDDLNRAEVERPPLKDSTRQKLQKELRPDVRELGEMLGKDLERFWWGTE